MAKPGNGATPAGKSNDEDMEDTAMDASTPATTTGRSAKKNRKSKRRTRDDEEVDAVGRTNVPGETPRKKSRLKSPEPVANTKSTAKDDEVEDSEMEEQEEKTESSQEAEQRQNQPVAAAASASTNDTDNGDKKMPASKNNNSKAAPGKKGVPPLPKLRVPAHQTPGKFSRDTSKARTTSIEPAGEVAVPSRKLVFGSSGATPTPTSTATKAANAGTGQAQAPKPNESTPPAENGSANADEGVAPEPPQPEQEQPASNDPLAMPIAWFILFVLVTIAIQYTSPSFIPTPIQPPQVSNACLDFYKRAFYSFVPPPTKQVVNQTRVEEIQQLERERKEHQTQKRKMLKDLEAAKKAMEREIETMEKDADTMKKDVKAIEERVYAHSEPVSKTLVKISRIDKLLKDKTSKELEETVKALPEIQKALSEEDRKKLLDLSSLDLWEIPQLPEDCLPEEDEEEEKEEDDDGEEEDEDYAIAGDDTDDAVELDVPLIDEDHLDGWSKDLQTLITESTDEILKDDEVADKIRKWIRSEIKSEVKWDKVLSDFTIDELSKQIKRKDKKGGSSRGGGSLQADAIQSQIDERLEIEIADQTGLFDYASIRNGAVVIREGPRATSKSLVQSLPYFNRVMAHLGLRFYGYGAEAALTPTDPPDALGQCWAFLGEEATKKKRKSKTAQDFTRGSVATLTVRLAKAIYVHSVVIEHPPREITDRMDSAIRVFRVVGYEDQSGIRGSYELGRFTYKIDGEETRSEFEVARKLSRQDVPKLRTISLAIESTWGESDDYGCLYRFRVHGDEMDDNE